MEIEDEPQSSEPDIVRIKIPAQFTETSRDEINRFTAEGDGLSGLSQDMLGIQTPAIYSVQANLGNAFRDVLPFDEPNKNLRIQLVSLDGKKAILSGEIHKKQNESSSGADVVRAEFAFIINPDEQKQEVDVLISDPGNLNLLIEHLTIQL